MWLTHLISIGVEILPPARILSQVNNCPLKILELINVFCTSKTLVCFLTPNRQS